MFRTSLISNFIVFFLELLRQSSVVPSVSKIGKLVSNGGGGGGLDMFGAVLLRVSFRGLPFGFGITAFF